MSFQALNWSFMIILFLKKKLLHYYFVEINDVIFGNPSLFVSSLPTFNPIRTNYCVINAAKDWEALK